MMRTQAIKGNEIVLIFHVRTKEGQQALTHILS